ncbi:LysM domain protein [Metarhizium robertsii]|uniref:LysM domain-containing protein n=2 Tax=Metarhizium robertsii TaxID=568076 RepID=E9F3B7_METRA|nr:LysM domain-containing protein [Metarhizium robertsii ARSEF 23]EFY97983.1 LysM domain-containing protein [Metarhizium robertsii ARSEF 23]EXU97480.1 LysM domain protein [Metarhizium robertsii]
MLGYTKILMLTAQLVAIATATPEVNDNVKRDVWPGCLDQHTTQATTGSKASRYPGVATPSPVRTPMASNCNKFCWVPPGAWCDSVAKNNGITTEKFIAWNAYVGPKCDGLWANYYACVGVGEEGRSA